MIKSNTVELAFREAFNTATKEKFKSNSLKSSLFVQMVGEEIMKAYDWTKFSLHCQRVDVKNQKKLPGEWLLNAIIAKNYQVEELAVNNQAITKDIIANVEWAIESEYATSLKAFNDDFSKLLSIKSKYKLYLNGYSSTHVESFHNYKNARLQTASNLIKKFNREGNYYFCFWPSPQKKGANSFWKTIAEDNSIKSEILTLHKWDSKKLQFNTY